MLLHKDVKFTPTRVYIDGKEFQALIAYKKWQFFSNFKSAFDWVSYFENPINLSLKKFSS